MHYLFPLDPERAARYQRIFERTSGFLPERTGVVPRTLQTMTLLAEARRANDETLAAPALSIAVLARATGRCRKRLAKLLRIATLAPDSAERCLAGTQPVMLTTATLFRNVLPISWREQRRVLGFA